MLAPIQNVTTMMLVEKTKEDLGLKLVYEPAPSYTYEDLYTIDVIAESEDVTISVEPAAEMKTVGKTPDVEEEEDNKKPVSHQMVI